MITFQLFWILSGQKLTQIAIPYMCTAMKLISEGVELNELDTVIYLNMKSHISKYYWLINI